MRVVEISVITRGMYEYEKQTYNKPKVLKGNTHKPNIDIKNYMQYEKYVQYIIKICNLY
jgi:hypothetical protein